jgi:hypothetical protein
MLKHALCKILTDWLEDAQPCCPTAITLHQHAIGFHLLHRGYIGTDWTADRMSMNPKQVMYGHATSSSSSGMPPMIFGPYAIQSYIPLTTLSHIIKTFELHQPYSTSCKTKHLHKTNTTSTSHSPNASHTHHTTYTTTFKPKQHSTIQASQQATNGVQRIINYFTRANGE